MRKARLLLIVFALLWQSECHAGSSFTTGSFLLNTATGNQSVTGLGFQPKLVLFFGEPKTDSQGEGNHARFLYGAATSSSKRWCLSGAAAWGSSNSSDTMGFVTNKCIGVVQVGSAAADVAADFVSMDADGFTINVTTGGTAYRIFYAAFGGADISADVGTFTPSAGTGDKSVTGVGFLPDIVGFVSNGGGITNGYSANIENSIGFAMSSSSRFVIANMSDNGEADTNSKSALVAKVIKNTWTGGDEDLADFVSMDSDGFTINFSLNGNVPPSAYWALKGAQFKIAAFSEPTSTGSTAVTGTGFSPSLVMAFGISKASSSSILDGWNIMMGAATTSSNMLAFDSDDPDAAATSQSQFESSTAKFLIHTTGGGASGNPTLNADATFTSMDSDGFTYNETTADATARENYYVAFAQSAATYTTIDGAVLDAATIN